MSKISSLIAFVFLLCISCDRPKIEDNQLIIPSELEEERSLTSLSQPFRYIPLLGEDIRLPYDADRIDFTKDLILVGDFTLSQSLYAFDRQSNQSIEIPIKKGEGPMEILAVNDFWVEEEIIYVLDGIGRKIMPLEYSEGNFKLKSPISLEIPLRRFAKTKTGFVGITGGGHENAVAFLDSFGKIISTHFPASIAYLANPLNPFHKVNQNGNDLILLHTSFEPILFRVDEGKLEEYFTIYQDGYPLKRPEKTDFIMDLQGFNSFKESLKSQPSNFTIFEFSRGQFVLLYFINDIPRLALNDGNVGYSFRLDNLNNDLSFDQPFPKITGVNPTGFVAMINVDQINHQNLGFENSPLDIAMKANPEAKVFLLEFQLKLN